MRKKTKIKNKMVDNPTSISEWGKLWLRILSVYCLLMPLHKLARVFFKEEKGLIVFIDKEPGVSSNIHALFRSARKQKNLRPIMLTDYELSSNHDFIGVLSVWIKANFLQRLEIISKAQYVIISQGIRHKYFFPFYISLPERRVINLWHGMPFKRLNFQIPGYDTYANRISAQKFKWIIASSEFEALALSSNFRVGLGQVLITGSPRCDSLIGTTSSTEMPRIKTILYAPTWREVSPQTEFFPFSDYDADTLIKVLERLNAKLILRSHPIDSRNFKFPSNNRIMVSNHKTEADTEALLASTDLLITDYSSIFFDFLLLDRPIIFVPYDLARYSTYRAFNFPYEQVTPGPKVSTFASFCEEIERALTHPENFSQERSIVRSIFHKYTDGHASDRIMQAITE